MIECVDCEEYLREIDRLESRLAAALDALRDAQTAFALAIWAQTNARLVISDVCRVTLPMPFEIVTWEEREQRVTVHEVRAALAGGGNG